MQPARQQCSSGDDAADSKGLVAHAVGCPSDRVRPVCSVSGLHCFFAQEEAGRADVCQGCPGRELCLSQSEPPCNDLRLQKPFCFAFAGREDSDQKFIDVRMRAVRRKIVVLSGKGGWIRPMYTSAIHTCMMNVVHGGIALGCTV